MLPAEHLYRWCTFWHTISNVLPDILYILCSMLIPGVLIHVTRNYGMIFGYVRPSGVWKNIIEHLWCAAL
jgi:hypothetical protein